MLTCEYDCGSGPGAGSIARNVRPPDCDDINSAAVTDLTTAKIRRREVLGGLIHEYERAA
jgi:hypothetical protein